MPVPETAVYKKDGVILGQHNVWFSGKFSVVFPEPESEAVQPAADNFFRLGVTAFYTGHIVMSLLRGMGVHSFIR